MNKESTEEEITARNKIERCNKFDNKKEKIDCMYKILHNITKAQDITNLTIREIIDNSEDPRWVPIHLVDDANAIILDVSRYKGNPQPMVNFGYTEEKINGIINKWNILKGKYEK